MKTHTMNTKSGHLIQFCVGEVGFLTIMDGRKIESFETMAEPLGITAVDVNRFMGDAPASGKTDDETMKTLMQLMCMCGYSNTLTTNITEKGAA